MGGSIMYNTHIPPETMDEMLYELGEKENIIVCEDEKKLYVPVGAMQDTFETSYFNLIMLDCNGKIRKINAFKALDLILSSYVRTVN